MIRLECETCGQVYRIQAFNLVISEVQWTCRECHTQNRDQVLPA